MSLEGLKLAALYSCKQHINQLLLDFLNRKVKALELEQSLRRLPNVAWYKMIADFLGVDDIFDERVVQAYWTGSESIVPTKVSGGKEILVFHNFIILESIINMVPNAISVDDCKVSLGVVLGANNDRIEVMYDALVFENGKFDLNKKKTTIKKGFLQEVKPEDWVIFHVGIGRKIPTEEEAKLICEKTIQSIKLFNEQAPRT